METKLNIEADGLKRPYIIKKVKEFYGADVTKEQVTSLLNAKCNSFKHIDIYLTLCSITGTSPFEGLNKGVSK